MEINKYVSTALDEILSELENKSKTFEASERDDALEVTIDRQFLGQLKRKLEKNGIVYDDPNITFASASCLRIFYVLYPMEHREKIIEVLPGECAITRSDDENPILAVKPEFGYILFYDGERAGVANLKIGHDPNKPLRRLLEEFEADDLYRHWIDGHELTSPSKRIEMADGFSFDPLDGKFGKYPFGDAVNGAVLKRAMTQKEMARLRIDWPVCIYNSENR